MFGNYFKIALRTLSKDRGYSAINLFGLAIGLASFILIVLFIKDELSYDRFHEKRGRVFRLAGEYDQGGDSRNRSALTTYRLKALLEASVPDILNVVRLGPGVALVEHGDRVFHEDRVLYADPAFFEVFSFELLEGEPQTVIAEPNTAVISESMARKYFADEYAMGQTLEFDGVLVSVTGLMRDMPHNSHFHGDFVVSMKTAEPFYPDWVLTNATGTSHYTYLELAEDYQPEKFESDLAALLKSRDEEFAASRTYFLQPLDEIHLHSNLSAEIEANGDILNIYVLSGVAFIILFMACVNYMNLAVARSAGRAREVGIRKVVGARRHQLVQQFLGESIIMVFLSFLLALLLVEIMMPVFNDLSGKSLEFSIFQNTGFLAGLMSAALLLGIAAGSYPAFLISTFRSVKALASRTGAGDRSSLVLRKTLVVLQFAMSVALLIGTLVIFDQLRFMQTKKLGLNPEKVLVVPFQTNEIAARYEDIRKKLLANPRISSVTASNNRLTSRVSHWREYRVAGQNDNVMIPTAVVDHDFFSTLQTEFVAGRDFSRQFQTDTDAAYILNESAVKFLDLKSPVGTSMVGSIYNGSAWSKKDAKVIGVVRDFHLASLHTRIQPTVFSVYSEKTTPLNIMAIRLQGEDLSSAVTFVDKIWREFAPGRPIRFTFMSDDLEQLYHAEQRFLHIFVAFGMLAVMITCLGVFGLSAFAASQRTKEVGIRKVLGASILKIVGLLSADFVKLMLIGNLLAWPLIYLAMAEWLQHFAYRIEIQPSVFLLAGGVALVIAMLTISFQTIKAALTDPVKTLHYE